MATKAEKSTSWETISAANGIYGDTTKELIHEKFGDGIMSVVDFILMVEKEENPKGDRVVININGKLTKGTGR